MLEKILGNNAVSFSLAIILLVIWLVAVGWGVRDTWRLFRATKKTPEQTPPPARKG